MHNFTTKLAQFGLRNVRAKVYEPLVALSLTLPYCHLKFVRFLVALLVEIQLPISTLTALSHKVPLFNLFLKVHYQLLELYVALHSALNFQSSLDSKFWRSKDHVLVHLLDGNHVELLAVAFGLYLHVMKSVQCRELKSVFHFIWTVG